MKELWAHTAGDEMMMVCNEGRERHGGGMYMHEQLGLAGRGWQEGGGGTDTRAESTSLPAGQVTPSLQSR